MSRGVFLLCLVAVIAHGTGCVRQQSSATDAKLDARLTALEGALHEVKQQLGRLQSDISGLESSVSDVRRYESVFLDVLSPKGYQRLDTSSGSFLVSLEDVQPYLDGFKLLLDIGNPSAATYRGFKVTARWGVRFEQAGKERVTYSAWRQSLKEKEVSLTEALRPGVWNKVVIHIAPAKPDQLGHLELSMKTDTVSLSVTR